MRAAALLLVAAAAAAAVAAAETAPVPAEVTVVGRHGRRERYRPWVYRAGDEASGALPLEVVPFNGTVGVPRPAARVDDVEGALQVWCGGRRRPDALLAWLPPHREHPLARLAEASGVPLDDGLVLVPQAAGGGAPGACSLRAVPVFEQGAWPAASVVGAPPGVPLALERADEATRDAFGARTTLFDLPEELACAERAPGGGFGGGGGGGGGEEVTSLLQVGAMARFVDAATKATASVVMDSVEGNCGRHAQQVINGQTTHAVLQRTPPQVLELAEPPMRTNASNLIVDAVAFTLTETLAKSLTNSLGPSLEERIAETLVPQLHQDVQPVLEKSLSSNLAEEVPSLTERSLLMQLAPHLTRAVTYATVPALTLSLAVARDPSNAILCHKCYYENLHCSECRVSNTDMYYGTYHGIYYAEYYADYYAEYYRSALLAMDRMVYPKAGAAAE